MGCDIHVYFEHRDDDGWRPLWEPDLHPEWWWNTILDERVKNGNVALMTGSTDEDANYRFAEEYFKTMSLEQARAEYGDDPHAVWSWPLPNFPDERWSVIDTRDYGWFTRIAGVGLGQDGALWPPRGLPEDLSPKVAAEAGRWDGDGHSHSWLMVDEILAQPSLSDRAQVKWLRAFIEDPARTRMCFWFDN